MNLNMTSGQLSPNYFLNAFIFSALHTAVTKHVVYSLLLLVYVSLLSLCESDLTL